MNMELPKIENQSKKEPHLKRETTSEDLRKINDVVRKTYEKDGIKKELIELFMIHNNQVFYLVRQISKKEEFNERELEIAELGAILHDVKKGGGI